MEPNPIASYDFRKGSGHILASGNQLYRFAYAGLENCTGFSCNRSIVLGIYDAYHDYQRKKVSLSTMNPMHI